MFTTFILLLLVVLFFKKCNLATWLQELGQLLCY